jgi:hypothetical protein
VAVLGLLLAAGPAYGQVSGTLQGEAGDGAGITFTSRTIYHAYDLHLFPATTPDPLLGDPLRAINRFYEAIDFGGFGISHGDVDVVTSLRYVTDFGTGFHRDTPLDLGIPAVDGRDQFQLLYLYVDWRNVIKDRLDLRMGRQLIVDDLMWYPLDGVKATVHLTKWASVDVYGGRPIPLGVIFSSETFILDGIDTVDDSALGGFTFGGTAWVRYDDFSFSAAYRQELRFRNSNILPFTGFTPNSAVSMAQQTAENSTIGLQEQLVGASAGYTLRKLNLDFYGHLTYNLLFADIEQARVGASYNPIRGVHFGGEYMRVKPLFAGDSIFNVFNIFPYDRGRVEATVEVIPGLLFEAGYLVEKFYGAPVLNQDFQQSDWSHGPSGGVTYRPTQRWGVGGYVEAATNIGGQYAFGGNYQLAQVFGDMNFFDGRLNGSLRFSYTGFQNDWFAGLAQGQVQPLQVSEAIDFGVRGQITQNVSARFNFIKNFASVYEGSYRIYSEMEVRY